MISIYAPVAGEKTMCGLESPKKTFCQNKISSNLCGHQEKGVIFLLFLACFVVFA